MSDTSLKLLAKDVEDLQVISAVLQDAIVPVCDMAWYAEDKNFVMVVQRLCRDVDSDVKLQRICCAVNMRGVDIVQTRGIDLSQSGTMLDLLAVMPEGEVLQFVFAGGARIRLQLNDWSMIIEDFGEAWPSTCDPCHDSTRAVG